MSLSTKPYKGARDFYPEEKRVLDYITNVWKNSCLSFGYEQYDAPLIEPAELYSSKSSEEIVNEQTYIFTDRGDRQVVIRPEMTPSVSRMVAGKRQELVYPLRLFSIPNVWRYERPQRGRLREHWQLNADLFGLDNLDGDFEIIMLADTIMRNFGAKASDFVIKISSRKLINYIFSDFLKISPPEQEKLVRLIDKKNKMSADSFNNALNEILTDSINSNSGLPNDINELLSINEISDLPEDIRSQESYSKLIQLLEMLSSSGVNNIKYDISLMRGFDYYTDIVFEVFDTDPNNNRSLFGGGRYDGLVGLFGVEPVPTVGFGMGDVRIRDFLETHNLLPELASEIDAVVIPIGIDVIKIQGILKTLRDNGVRLAVDSTDKKIDKKIKNTTKRGIKFVLFIGEDELVSNEFTVKNLDTGEETTDEISSIATILKS